MSVIRQRSIELASRVRQDQKGMRAEVVRRLHDVAPEYYAVDATDFLSAGWSAFTAVVEGALTVLETWEMPTRFAPELAAEALTGARNGLPWSTLARTYHLTHQVLWDTILTDIGPTRWSRDEPRALKVISDLLFQYFDYLTTEAGEVYFQSRSLMQGSSDRRKRQAVTRILNGAVLQDNELGYRLSQSHVAVVGWGGEPREAIMIIGQRLGAETLVVAADDGVVWGWWGHPQPVERSTVEAVLPVDSTSMLMVGSAQNNRSGFVASHQQAKMVAALYARKLVDHETRVAHFADYALLAIGTANETNARIFVQHELRGLAEGDARSEMLRLTLQKYSEAGLNAGRTAVLLGIAERSVRYRLTDLEQTLGRDFRSRMPELVLAVLLLEALNVQGGRYITSLVPDKDPGVQN